MPTIEEDIVRSYSDDFDEDKRLSTDIGPLEYARTQELLRRLLAPAPATVYDVGGATGPYSFWLASIGYTVHLLDLVPLHIQKAQARASDPRSPKLSSARVGDARQLPFADDSADAVLLHGPLYHLPQLNDRMKCLREAHRVLKPTGLLCAFGITRYAGLIHALTKGLVFEDRYRSTIMVEVQTGRRGSVGDKSCFRSAYFHLPSEMEAEVREAGFGSVRTYGILGPAWQVPNLEENWLDPRKREAILEMARITENEPVLGPRFLTVSSKGGRSGRAKKE